MRGTVGRFALFGSLLAAVLAGVVHVNYLKGLQDVENVVVVTKEVPAYQKLDKTNLVVKSMPKSAVGEGALTSLTDAEGRYARGLILPNEILRKKHVLEAAGGSLSAKLTDAGDGKVRAMAVKVSTDTGVANTLQAGDKVDMLVALQTESKGVGTVAKIIATGVPVLFTGLSKQEGIAGNGGTAEGTVVLQVLPELAEELAFAQTSGTIWLLTNPNVAAPGETQGFNMDTFMRKYPAAAPKVEKKG